MTIVCGKEKKSILKTQKHLIKIANKANTRCDYIQKYNLRALYTIDTNANYDECKKFMQVFCPSYNSIHDHKNGYFFIEERSKKILNFQI